MSKPQLSNTEWKVMDAVWSRRGEVTAREVLAFVQDDTGWAYTTVKTMLDRLVEKGAVLAQREGKTTRFEARITRRAARRSAARSLVEKAFGGAPGALVHHLVKSERLSADDREELRRMLDELDGEVAP